MKLQGNWCCSFAIQTKTPKMFLFAISLKPQKMFKEENKNWISKWRNNFSERKQEVFENDWIEEENERILNIEREDREENIRRIIIRRRRGNNKKKRRRSRRRRRKKKKKKEHKHLKESVLGERDPNPLPKQNGKANQKQWKQFGLLNLDVWKIMRSVEREVERR